jgi:hypothetical protein
VAAGGGRAGAAARRHAKRWRPVWGKGERMAMETWTIHLLPLGKLEKELRQAGVKWREAGLGMGGIKYVAAWGWGDR